MNRPMIGWGTVRHARLRPVRHEFAYPTLFLLLPMRTMHRRPVTRQALAHNRPGAISFHDQDHGDGRANALEWLDGLLAGAGIADADGEAWLHCYPRMLGYTFKPVSFWYCHRADGSLRAVVVEVNNTFGERHCYLLDRPAWGREATLPKAFPVSPFCSVTGQYSFRFLFTPGREHTVARIDYHDPDGLLLRTSVSGALQPATAAALRRAAWRFPLLTAGIVARIHWQALRLWLARVPLVRRSSAAPSTPVIP